MKIVAKHRKMISNNNSCNNFGTDCKENLIEYPSLIYGLDHECRALCSQFNEDLPTRFFVGTQCLKLEENEVHVLEHIDECNHLAKAIFQHPVGEIWHLIAFSKKLRHLLSCYSSLDGLRKRNHFTLWEIPIDLEQTISENESTLPLNLEKIIDFDAENFDENFGQIARLKPDGENELILALETKLARIDLETQQSIGQISLDHSQDQPKISNKLAKISTFHWSPHFNSNIVALTTNSNIFARDLRTSSNAWTISQAHSQSVRDLDFNSNSQHYVVTCGDDCEVKFWDLRNTSRPALKMLQHSHWVWCVRYNQFHDDFVLSSSSDGNVNLLRASSIASQPYGQLIDDELDDDDDGTLKNLLGSKSKFDQQRSNNVDDGLVRKFEDHADSVYAIEWSPNDPWIFASLSYDGRLIINRVPEEEKMKFLN